MVSLDHWISSGKTDGIPGPYPERRVRGEQGGGLVIPRNR
jgi:hypothetical protein